MKKLLPFILILTLFILAAAVAFRDLVPEKPGDPAAPAREFSAGRAMDKLKIIAARPHPCGFVANHFVRDYLLDELTNAGLSPVVIPATVERNDNSYYVENIVAVKKGTGAGNAGKILLSAHYDARGEAPGAGDNGYAVAAVLETLRALKSYPPLKNDLVIFFPDGEELGSLGAKAFVSQSPLSDSIGLVLNFDGRGSSGTSLMFETSSDNYQLIREFNSSKTSSFANSLSDEVYRLIPNYTDFTWYMKKIPRGLNFAHLGDVENYHNATDDIAHLDQGTLQSHGNSMLACVLHFGNISLKEKKTDDAVYFHLLFPRLIIYKSSLAIPLAILVMLFFLVLLYSGFRQKQLSAVSILKAAGIFLLRIITIAIAVHYTWKFIGPMNAGFGKYELDWIPNGDHILAGFLAATLVIFLVWQSKFTREIGEMNLVMGNLFVWLILLFASTLYFTGGSFLFLWPLIFNLTGVLIFIRKRERFKREALIALLMLLAIPGIYLFTQVIWLFYQTMTLRMAGAIAAMFMVLLGSLQLAISLLFYNDKSV